MFGCIIDATAMFYAVNGYEVDSEAGAMIALTNDVAEGLLDVQNIAAVLKAWAQPLPVPDDWMGTDDTLF
jgi:prophage maintenance system killer protein